MTGYSKEVLFVYFISVKTFKLNGKFCPFINNQGCFLTFPSPDFLCVDHIPFNLSKWHTHFWYSSCQSQSACGHQLPNFLPPSDILPLWIMLEAGLHHHRPFPSLCGTGNCPPLHLKIPSLRQDLLYFSS